MLPPAPSGVNTLPESQQAAVVLSIFIALAICTLAVCGPLFGALRKALPDGWFDNWQRSWPVCLGAVFLIAGVYHFQALEAFEAIYPPQGTWGFWYLPGSAEFHVKWTGVAEVAGGAGLLLGSLGLWVAELAGKEAPGVLRPLASVAAGCLCLLTVVVSPANIYMYTHGAQMVGLTPSDVPVPVAGHVARFFLQVVLLSLLYTYSADMRGDQAEREA